MRRILVDTNVILDVLQHQEPFFEASYGALKEAANEKIDCIVPASAATDIFYILRKALKSTRKAKMYLRKVSELTRFVDVTALDVQIALNHQIDDFEDAVIDAVAERSHCDLILTRNVADFKEGLVPAVEPAMFMIKEHGY